MEQTNKLEDAVRIRLPREIKEKLMVICRKRGTNVSQELRPLIIEHVNRITSDMVISRRLRKIFLEDDKNAKRK